jgi:ribonuclease HI
MSTNSADVVRIYADGACKGNPGRGGWGAIVRIGDVEQELFGGEPHTTNNRMELTAVMRALEALPGPSTVEVYTDSQYVQKGISEWMRNWKRNGWRTADKKPVKNAELWQELDRAASTHRVTWHWVKGHAGHPENERADRLANRGVSSRPARLSARHAAATAAKRRPGRRTSRRRVRASHPRSPTARPGGCARR